jgi:hypothetical protein
MSQHVIPYLKSFNLPCEIFSFLPPLDASVKMRQLSKLAKKESETRMPTFDQAKVRFTLDVTTKDKLLNFPQLYKKGLLSPLIGIEVKFNIPQNGDFIYFSKENTL